MSYIFGKYIPLETFRCKNQIHTCTISEIIAYFILLYFCTSFLDAIYHLITTFAMIYAKVSISHNHVSLFKAKGTSVVAAGVQQGLWATAVSAKMKSKPKSKSKKPKPFRKVGDYYNHDYKCNHHGNRGKICILCLKKSKGKVMNENHKNIFRRVFKDYDLYAEYLPFGLCLGCQRILLTQGKNSLCFYHY